MNVLTLLINRAVFSIVATTLITTPEIPTPTSAVKVEPQGQHRPLWRC